MNTNTSNLFGKPLGRAIEFVNQFPVTVSETVRRTQTQNPWNITTELDCRNVSEICVGVPDKVQQPQQQQQHHVVRLKLPEYHDTSVCCFRVRDRRALAVLRATLEEALQFIANRRTADNTSPVRGVVINIDAFTSHGFRFKDMARATVAALRTCPVLIRHVWIMTEQTQEVRRHFQNA